MTIRCLPARVSVSAAFAAGVMLSACGDNSHPLSPPQPDVAASPTPRHRPPGTEIEIEVLSNRADLVSGGDTLIEIIAPGNGPAQRLHVLAGARDVSDAFARRADGRIVGLITGLDVGQTVITAGLAGERGASLTVTNHPI